MERRSREQIPITIVSLSPDEWEKYRDLKIASLGEEPVAFEDAKEGVEKYRNRSEEEWREILSGKMSGGRPGESIQFFARSGDKVVGMVSAIVPEEGIATVQHMYAMKEFRGRGIGRDLLQNLIDALKSRGDLKKIELEVVATQIPAIELYKSLGFEEAGMVPGGIQRGGENYEELKMEINLEEES